MGLAAMGTHRAYVYEQLNFCLYQDNALTGEAAGLAMGLDKQNPELVEAMVFSS